MPVGVTLSLELVVVNVDFELVVADADAETLVVEPFVPVVPELGFKNPDTARFRDGLLPVVVVVVVAVVESS